MEPDQARVYIYMLYMLYILYILYMLYMLNMVYMLYINIFKIIYLFYIFIILYFFKIFKKLLTFFIERSLKDNVIISNKLTIKRYRLHLIYFSIIIKRCAF